MTPAAPPRAALASRPARPSLWLVLAAVFASLWTASSARALPVRELPLLSSSSKYKTLPSLEPQERASRVPETRIRDPRLRRAGLHRADGLLNEDLIRVFALLYDELASVRRVVSNNPINFRDPLGLRGGGGGFLPFTLQQLGVPARTSPGRGYAPYQVNPAFDEPFPDIGIEPVDDIGIPPVDPGTRYLRVINKKHKRYDKQLGEWQLKKSRSGDYECGLSVFKYVNPVVTEATIEAVRDVGKTGDLEAIDVYENPLEALQLTTTRTPGATFNPYVNSLHYEIRHPATYSGGPEQHYNFFNRNVSPVLMQLFQGVPPPPSMIGPPMP